MALGCCYCHNAAILTREKQMFCKRCGCFMFSGLFSRAQYCRPCTKSLERQRLAVEACVEQICALPEDGMTAQAVSAIVAAHSPCGLLDGKDSRRAIWTMAVEHVCRDGRLTRTEESSLVWLKNVLRISDEELVEFDSGVRKLREMSSIQDGRLPSITVIGIPMQKSEKAHFHFPSVELHQERVVSRGYEGGSAGLSFRICRGVTYRIGAHRGRLVSRSSVVHQDTGQIVLTSKRFLFSGAKRAFSIPLTKILSVQPYADGVCVIRDSLSQSDKPFYFLCSDAEMLSVGLSACINL